MEGTPPLTQPWSGVVVVGVVVVVVVVVVFSVRGVVVCGGGVV